MAIMISSARKNSIRWNLQFRRARAAAACLYRPLRGAYIVGDKYKIGPACRVTM
ncbi:hypothetical protein [Bradyrhizobium embrapense]